MHFSIPDTQEFTDKTGSMYIGYNIYVNGSPHCVLRYRQLNSFHEQLKRQFGACSLPPFPPKKYLPMTDRQLEERRAALEKYIQLLSSQSGKVGSSEAFRSFFLSAQADSKRTEPVCLEIVLTNSQSVHVDVKSTDGSGRVLDEAARILNLPVSLLPFFSLYAIQWSDHQPTSCSSSTNSSSSAASSSGSTSRQHRDFRLTRRLQNFESPFLTLGTLNNLTGRKHTLTLRKSYWDTSFDQELLSSEAGLNLLFHQTVTDVGQGWISLSKEAKHQLKVFQADNCKKQYLELARTLKFYSYLHFENCVCDFPEMDSTITLSLGGRELLIRSLDCSNFSGAGPKEFSFKVTRIRCWRLINSVEGMLSRPLDGSSQLQKLELSFEYLMNKDNLRWITIESDQAVLISMSLQGMVDELLMKRKGLKYGSSLPASTASSYNRQPDSGQVEEITNTSHLREACSNGTKSATRTGSHCSSQQSIFSANGHMNGNHANGIKYNVRKEIGNDAFDGIGDDDL